MRSTLVCAGLLFVGLAAFAQESKNLLINPNFEEVKEGKPAGWIIGGISEGGKGSLASSEEKPHAGKRCARIQGNAEWATFVSTQIPVKKGKTYELKGFLRVNKGQAYLKIDYFQGEKYLGMTMTEAADSKDWTEQTIISELSGYPDATHLTATLVGSSGEFDASFDDLSVMEK
jgi:hypothetical protein